MKKNKKTFDPLDLKWRKNGEAWRQFSMRLMNDINNVEPWKPTKKDEARINVLKELEKLPKKLYKKLLDMIKEGKSNLKYMDFLQIRRGKSKLDPGKIKEWLEEDIEKLKQNID